MKQTTILEPLDESSDTKQLNDILSKIQKELEEVKDNDTFEEFLSLVGVDEQKYLEAIRSSLKSPNCFLTRSVH
ncbi:hypothetical protein DPMN_080268 [Dreissena polymorpha]|uniref:Uncharacterized protein n=1 Tax=Dreissena polymorpha TaxID=45954 RepID=A0A9D3YQJ6_DREPO|nr:hypothetical protein DPMN_080268 [Dreissena polymorpha]